MRDPRSTLSRSLVVWFGVVQMAHLVALTRAGIILFFGASSVFPFPAPPPPEGWNLQSQHLLVGTGIADALGIGLSLAFVYGYFAGARWYRWAGICSTTMQIYSAIVFGYGTLLAGAWPAHPVGYAVMSLLFAPMPLLWFALALWSVQPPEVEE